jgi:outer membrane protein OmpA-like peptidoglycan-associated protein
MPVRTLLTALCLTVAASAVVSVPSEAQFPDKIKNAAKRAVENEAADQTERLLRNAMRCAVNDPRCVERAEENGEEVIFTDAEGEVITDEDGAPITDRERAAETAGTASGPAVVEANYDFEAGTDVIFEEDYAGDNLGDFPRRFTFVKGNWDIVERDGRRMLRNTGPRHAAFRVELPEALPEQFTLEFDVHFTSSQPKLGVATAAPENDRLHFLTSNWIEVDENQTGLARSGGEENRSLPESLVEGDEIVEGVVPVRVMADGRYVKVYLGTRRVANVPNATLPRTSTLFFENLYHADGDKHQMFIGPLRVAAGGRDLYDVLETKGRVAVRDILFDTDRATIRPASEEVLSKIGAMLTEHPELRLMIEGHTDDQGEFDHNMTLSTERAEAVRAYLVERFGVEADRLKTMGLGPTQPVDGNDTDEGRQKNRRVELVRIGG